MVEDSQWELALLATVQAFYSRLLGEHLGGEIPAPSELAPDTIAHTHDAHPTVQKMHRWIQLLDMAITPAMLRLGMPPELDAEVAEALLRYFARHRDDTAANRDKTDLVATFLYRHPRVPGQWEQHEGYGLDGSPPPSPLEIALIEILSESDVPELSEQHVQHLREFGPLLDQANRFQDFTALMDSGIVSRVRDLKASLGESIYHPSVLATIAPYNATFGDHFHALFAAAAGEIKTFACQLEELGGTILTTLDGVEITVEHVAALDEKSLLSVDYVAALEKFRRVSRLKKELERKPPVRHSQPTFVHAVHTADGSGAAVAPAREFLYTPPAITPQALSVEEAKLRRVEEAIRIFVRVADPKFRQIVPMRYFNLMLNQAEIAAYTADYLDQASPSADTARWLLRVVALTARVTTEMEELKRAPRASAIWNLHADLLAVVLDLCKQVLEAVDRLTETDRNRPTMQANEDPIRPSLEKLHARAIEAEKLLASD